MRLSKLRQLIREELKILKEIDFEKVYSVKGILITDDNKRFLNHILSDIRSLPGVTTTRVEEIPNQEEGSSSYRSILHLKIDPYPYIKSPRFSHAQSTEIVNDVKKRINKIEGVISVQFSNKVEIQD